MKRNSSLITHCHLQGKEFDPYQIFKSKCQRLSWSSVAESEVFIDKQAVIEWFATWSDYSDQTLKSVLVDGILESQFNNITFILTLIQEGDFATMASKEAYQILYEFVINTPKGIQEWIDEIDFKMSCDVLALLSKNR
ncbi:hypothetical protein HGG78_16945 [Vibrio aestuarianus]|uniref:hypothetical protein n=1 Tax=Vibrio aestuarianus TaxID=28171 RepID=UPI0006A62539|nr:hypothetical protein [Vibrio aestuarianus]KOE88506.1 hypothetical protein ACS86_01825 [Vibrio alginolyticus]NGZ15416.1 hypothetical protein [Vibrio aestuarianus]NKZ51564.1 hypothetical protein [Vibrio aestuarianus]